MKTIFKSIFAILLALAINGITTGCSSSSTSDPAPVAACKVKTFAYEYNYPSGNVVSSGITTSTNTFNGELIVTSVSNISSSFTGTPTSTYTATNTYTYDANGFLQSLAYTATQPTGNTGTGTTSSTNSNTAYTYSNGRLIKAVSSDNAGVVYSTLSYEYDAQGMVIKVITTNTSYIETQTYSNGVLTAMTRVNGGGQVLRNYTVENGRISKYTSGSNPTPYFEYTYDAQGNLVETKSWATATTLTNKLTYEYSATGKVISTPAQKGFPTLSSLLGQSNLRTKTTIFNATGVKVSESISAYTFNAKGYVLTQNDTQTSYNANGTVNGTPSTTRQTYTYQDCQ